MPGKIYFRKSSRSDRRERGRTLRVVAVTGADLTFTSSHLARNELKLIAFEAGAELVDLDGGKTGGPK